MWTVLLERERFQIEARYYLDVTGELEKAAQTYELWKQTYPRDAVPYGNLSFIYISVGNLEKTLEEGLEALRLQPDAHFYHGRLGRPLLMLQKGLTVGNKGP
jgi:hypothetical protein